jgi:excisionase family DNA binding protein
MQMMRKKRTEITIETDRIVVISRRNLQAQSWCGACNKRVSMVTIDEAARLARVSARTVYRWVEDEKLHFTETSDGRLLICSESIPQIGLITR